jgi:hypothetical protein
MAGYRERLPIGPFMDWINERFERYEAEFRDEYAGHNVGPADRLATELGLSRENGPRQILRWRKGLATGSRDGVKGDYPTETYGRPPVEEALRNVGIPLEQLYPELESEGDEFFERYCPGCIEQVTVGDDALCPWCETPTWELDSIKLPPRERPPEPEKPATRVCHTPRVRKGKPVYLDVMLERRRIALEAFAETASIQAAAATLNSDLYTFNSAEHAFRDLLEREGWWERPRARGLHSRASLEEAAKRVRVALDTGKWKRVPRVRRSPPNPNRGVSDNLVRDARRMYDEGMSFLECAEALLHRTKAKDARSLKSTLINEWNRRGWPRRTGFTANTWKPPAGQLRCVAKTKSGTRCRRYAKQGHRRCRNHLKKYSADATARAVAASRAAYSDAVPPEPWRSWCRQRAEELGSAKKLHERINGAVSYDTLSDWSKRRGSAYKLKTVRRSTIDRVLAEWGDGTTFEDIYPVAVAT